MSANHSLPIPPAAQSPKGPGDAKRQQADDTSRMERMPENLAEQDRQGNIKQNTTNQGYQQDR